MVGKKLIAFVAFVMLITLLEQIKSGVHAGRMTKPKRAGRVKVIHTGPRVRKLKKKGWRIGEATRLYGTVWTWETFYFTVLFSLTK